MIDEKKYIADFFAQQLAKEKQDKLARFKHLNVLAKKGQILFVGSSLMEQFPIGEFVQGENLSCAVYNRGIGGYTTAELLDTLDICVYALRPAHIFINIGTNDLNGADYDKEALIDRYGQILAGIRSELPKTQLYVMAYYPVNPIVAQHIPFMRETLRFRTNRRICEANKAVQALAQKYDAVFLDLNAPLKDENGDLKAEYTVEGMHLYANGYAPVFEQLLPLLKHLHPAMV